MRLPYVRQKWWQFKAWLRWHPVTEWFESLIFHRHNVRVIRDFEWRLGRVLCDVTHGMSKPYYELESMLAEINSKQNDDYQVAYDEGHDDGRVEGGYICKGGLTLQAMRTTNLARQAGWPNPECDSWSLGDWGLACISEFGEAGNIVKKILRGDFTLDTGPVTIAGKTFATVRDALGEEFADGLTYLDVWASKAGIDLAEVYVAKWNAVAEKRGLKVRIVIEHEATVE